MRLGALARHAHLAPRPKVEREEARAKMEEETLRDDMERLQQTSAESARILKEERRRSNDEVTRLRLSLENAGLRQMKQVVWQLLNGDVSMRLSLWRTHKNQGMLDAVNALKDAIYVLLAALVVLRVALVASVLSALATALW